jgi:hypothetical protein
VTPMSAARASGAAAVSAPVAVASVRPPGAAPRQRGAAVVPPAGGDGYADSAGYSGPYGPGLSGSAWAERGAAAEYDAPATADAGYATETPAAQRPSRRHAAPDTGTDIARYGLSSLPTPEAPGYGAGDYGADYDVPGSYAIPGGHNAPAGFDAESGFDSASGYDAESGYDDRSNFDGHSGYGSHGYAGTGAAAWTSTPGHYGYADPTAQDQPETGGHDYPGPPADDRPRSSGFGRTDSPFFAQDSSGGFVLDNEYPQPDQPEGTAQNTYGRPADQYGPDPMAAQPGWAPRSHEPRGGW